MAGLGLDKIGVHVVNGKVLVDEKEQTNLPHIYALGDVATGKKELLSVLRHWSVPEYVIRLFTPHYETGESRLNVFLHS